MIVLENLFWQLGPNFFSPLEIEVREVDDAHLALVRVMFLLRREPLVQASMNKKEVCLHVRFVTMATRAIYMFRACLSP